MFICLYSKSFQFWICEPQRSRQYMESGNRMWVITYDKKYCLTYLLKKSQNTNIYKLERQAEGLVVKVSAQTTSKLSPHGYAKASSLVTWCSLVCPKPLRHTSVLDQGAHFFHLHPVKCFRNVKVIHLLNISKFSLSHLILTLHLLI